MVNFENKYFTYSSICWSKKYSSFQSTQM